MASRLFTKTKIMKIPFSRSKVIDLGPKNKKKTIYRDDIRKVEDIWDKKWDWFDHYDKNIPETSSFIKESLKQSLTGMSRSLDSPLKKSLTKNIVFGDQFVKLNFSLTDNEQKDKEVINKLFSALKIKPVKIYFLMDDFHRPTEEIVCSFKKNTIDSSKIKEINSKCFVNFDSGREAFEELCKIKSKFEKEHLKKSIIVEFNGTKNSPKGVPLSAKSIIGDKVDKIMISNRLKTKLSQFSEIIEILDKRISEHREKLKEMRKPLEKTALMIRNLDRVEQILLKRIFSFEFAKRRNLERTMANPHGVESVLKMLAHLYLNGKTDDKMDFLYETILQCLTSPKHSHLYSDKITKVLKDFLHSRMGHIVMKRIANEYGDKEQSLEDHFKERMEFFSEKERNINTDRFTPILELTKIAMSLNYDYFHTDFSDTNFFLQQFVRHSVEHKATLHVLDQLRDEKEKIIFNFEPKTNPETLKALEKYKKMKKAILEITERERKTEEIFNTTQLESDWGVNAQIIRPEDAVKEQWNYVE